MAYSPILTNDVYNKKTDSNFKIIQNSNNETFSEDSLKQYNP